MKRPVTSDDARLLLIFAFRYALGRASSAPSDMSDMVLRYRHLLTPQDTFQMVNDIDHAIATGSAGWDCDVATWKALADKLRNP